MKCYGLGLGLDTFRMVALMENFRKLEPGSLLSACSRYALHSCAESHTRLRVSSHPPLSGTSSWCMFLALPKLLSTGRSADELYTIEPKLRHARLCFLLSAASCPNSDQPNA